MPDPRAPRALASSPARSSSARSSGGNRNDIASEEPGANAAIEKLSGKPLSAAVLDRAWANLRLTLDPIASSLQTSADHGVAVGTSKKTDLTGIYDLTLLNEVLAAHDQEPASDAGLGAGGR